MYTERFSLPFLSRVLIASAERRRPGLGAWTSGTREELRKVFLTELAEVRGRFFELFDDKAYWDRVERAILDDCFPRYAAVAEKQTGLERADYGLWRGGDLLARITYAGLGLLIGAFIVRAPFIPIPATWDALILAFMVLAPFVPDVQVWSKKRAFEKSLRGIVGDMADAAEQQKLYQSLPEIAGVTGVSDLGGTSSSTSHDRSGEKV